MSAAYDREQYQAAADRLLKQPEQLTDEDISLFELVSPAVADHARRKRAGQPGLDELQLDGVPSAQVNRAATMRDVFQAILSTHWLFEPFQASYEWRVRQTTARTDFLEAEVKALKSEVDTLRALLPKLQLDMRELRHRGMKFRGLFEEGALYEEGDTVIWGGSLWIARQRTNAKPGTPAAASRDWLLAAMRGKEGKQGPQGPPGRDAR